MDEVDLLRLAALTRSIILRLATASILLCLACPEAWAAITASNLTTGNAASVTSTTTASISPTANALVIVSVASRNFTGAGPATVPTVTGASGTWVQIATVSDGSAGARTVTLFRDLSASPGSGILTIDFAGVNQGSVGWSIDQLQGTDTTGTNGSGAIVQTGSLNPATGTTTSGLITLSAFGSANNAAYGFIRNSGAVTIVVGSGFTSLANFMTAGGEHVAEWKLNDNTVDWTWASQSVTSVAIAAEIKASTGPVVPQASPWPVLGLGPGGALGGAILLLQNTSALLTDAGLDMFL